MTNILSAFTMGYYPDGRRAWKQVGANPKFYYFYDGDTLAYETDSSGNTTNAFAYGAGGLAQRRAGVTSYNYTFDPSGNVVQRHQGSAAQLADFTTLYDGFGQQLGCISANSGAQASAAGNEMIGFGGQFGCWTDNETSMNTTGAPLRRFPWVWMGHREYDPSACRFLTRDPIDYDGGINLYAYCGNNPIMFADPSGLDITLGDPNNPLLVFTWSGTGRGLQTGIAATGHAFSFGLYNGGEFRNDPGFGESTFLAEVGRDLLIEAATAGAGEWIHTARAEKLVAGALSRAKAATPLGRNFGTRLHSALSNEIKAPNNKYIKSELSYISGDVAKYGTKGSIRVDVQINRLIEGTPKKILDLKTGSAQLSTTRIRQIQSHVPNSSWFKSWFKLPVKMIR